MKRITFPSLLIFSPIITNVIIVNQQKLIRSEGITNPPLAKAVNGVERTSPRSMNFLCFNCRGLFFVPRPLLATFVFLQWCASEAASCPRHKTLNEDMNFGLHLTAPLKKHFVARRRVILLTSFVASIPVTR
jgi:hypothetical protein